MAYGSNGRLKVVSLAIISLILASCGAGRTIVSENKTSTTLQDDIILYGRQYLGKPYRYASKGPNSFDCSGYTSFIFKKFGYRLGSSSAGQDRQVPSVDKRENLRKGDLVFFEGHRKNGKVGHVGIVTEALSNGRFKFIHASTNNGVIVSSSTEPYYASRYLRGGRVLEENASYVTRRDPTAVKRQQPSFPAVRDTGRDYPSIPEIIPGKEETKTGSAIASIKTTGSPVNSDSVIILVQTDPQKNAPVTHHPSTANGKGETKDALLQAKSQMVLREEENFAVPSPPKSHIVKMGETLYSISRQYGCTVEQLKEWNPQVGSLLQTGEKLDIFM